MLCSRRALALFAAASAALAAHALAEVRVFNIVATGAQEVNASGVPNQGDPDGQAVGTVTLDNGTGAGSTGSVSVDLLLSNIDLSDLRGHHIHQAPAGSNGPIVLDLGDPDTVLTGGNRLFGTFTGLSATTVTNVLNNPAGFYYNLHNGPFPPGAVRAQLPEPSLAAIALVGGVIAARRRRS
jgi:hypothetical protein